MDRNEKHMKKTHENAVVATREGGVDRNADSISQNRRAAEVATREGGVDRNTLFNFLLLLL